MFKFVRLFNSKVNTFILNQSLKKRYKVYLDYYMVFYDFKYNQLNANSVFDKSEFFDSTTEGIPAFLKLQIPNSENYIYFPDFDVSKLGNNEKYAVLTYRYTQSYSTKSVSGVSCLEIEKIKITHNRNR